MLCSGMLDLNFRGQKAYPCLQCGKQYKHPQSLHKHCRYECGKEARFLCDECPYKSKRKDNLMAHIVLRHRR